MSALISLENNRASRAVAEYGAANAWPLDVAASFDEAMRLARFRPFTTVICDASFEGPYCLGGLEIARAAKRVDPRTRTILLATWISPALRDATEHGLIDVVLLKPQALSLLFSYAVRTPFPHAALGVTAS